MAGAASIYNFYDPEYANHLLEPPLQFEGGKIRTADRFELYRLNGIARRQPWGTIPKDGWHAGNVLASVKIEVWRQVDAHPNGRLPSSGLQSGEEGTIKDHVAMDIEDPWNFQFDAENNYSYAYMRQEVTQRGRKPHILLVPSTIPRYGWR